jgi:hypothetical protein
MFLSRQKKIKSKHTVLLSTIDPPWHLRFITRNTRRKKTLKLSRPKTIQKPNQNKTKQNSKKRKKASSGDTK